MTRKLIALALALILVTALFSGCQKPAKEENSETTATTAATTTAKKETAAKADADKETTAAAPSGPEMSDVDGMTAAGVLPIVTEAAKVSVGFAPNASVTDFDDNVFTNYLEALTGVDIEFVFFPTDNTVQQVELKRCRSSARPPRMSFTTCSSPSATEIPTATAKRTRYRCSARARR